MIIEDEKDNAPILHRSKRQRKEKSFGPNLEVYLIKGTKDNLYSRIRYLYGGKGDSYTYSEVMVSLDLDFWEKAINDKMESFMGNNT